MGNHNFFYFCTCNGGHTHFNRCEIPSKPSNQQTMEFALSPRSHLCGGRHSNLYGANRKNGSGLFFFGPHQNRIGCVNTQCDRIQTIAMRFACCFGDDVIFNTRSRSHGTLCDFSAAESTGLAAFPHIEYRAGSRHKNAFKFDSSLHAHCSVLLVRFQMLFLPFFTVFFHCTVRF